MQLAAQENIRIVNCTTAAQYFHVLRRQALHPKARPLVLLTPKGLLRLKESTSRLDDLTKGGFRQMLDDPGLGGEGRRRAGRLVLCSGKVYYDIVGHAAHQEAEGIAVARLEQVYPFPVAAYDELLSRYPNITELIWAQEEPQNMTLEYVQGAEDHLRLSSGRMPEERDEIVPLPFRLGQPRARLVEIAIPQVAANQLSLGVGDVLYLEPDFEDVLVGPVPLSERRMIAAEVTGTFVPKNDADRGWLDDAKLDRAVTRDTDQRRYVYGFGLFAPSAYGEVAEATAPLPMRYSWHFDVDAGGFDAGGLDRLDSDVRKLDATFGETTFGQRLGTGVRTGLSDVLAAYRSDRDAAAAVIAIGATGLLALALAVVALLGGLAANRRGESIALVRSRGGATWQVLGAEAVEGIAVALPAAALGCLLAFALTAGRSAAPSILLVAGIVLATGGLLAAAASGAARSGLAARGRDEVAVGAVSPRRLAVEAAVVVSSLVGVYLLRRRGLSDENGFDPYLAAVPLLLGLAAGIVAVRIYPWPVRFLAAAAGRRRDLVPSLALRRVARQPGVTAAPLLVLLLGVSVAVFAAVMIRDGWSAHVETSGSMTADAESFLLVHKVDAYENGQLVFSRERSCTVPRDLV